MSSFTAHDTLEGEDDTPGREFSSPSCSMHEADNCYIGFLGTGEVVEALNELLEIERAAVWITLESGHAAGRGPMAETMRSIQRDEERCCSMLRAHIEALGGSPAATMGAFYETAKTIGDLRSRLAFLNRGQEWVVRKLRGLLPRLRDDRLHADLRAMLRAHETNIVRAQGL